MDTLDLSQSPTFVFLCPSMAAYRLAPSWS
jgi:hypothetical protein